MVRPLQDHRSRRKTDHAAESGKGAIEDSLPIGSVKALFHLFLPPQLLTQLMPQMDHSIPTDHVKATEGDLGVNQDLSKVLHPAIPIDMQRIVLHQHVLCQTMHHILVMTGLLSTDHTANNLFSTGRSSKLLLYVIFRH